MYVCINVSSLTKYHTCHSHVNCPFVSCIGRCGCTAKGSWYTVPSKKVKSHITVIDIQADVVHQRMPNVSYCVQRR